MFGEVGVIYYGRFRLAVRAAAERGAHARLFVPGLEGVRWREK